MIAHLVLAALATVFAIEALGALAMPGWARPLVAAAAATGALVAPALILQALAVAGAAGLVRAALARFEGAGPAAVRLPRRSPDLPRR